MQETASKLKKPIYVDNFITSYKSEELENFMQQSKEIMSSACFDLTGCMYNGYQSENICNEIIPLLGLNWLTSKYT